MPECCDNEGSTAKRDDHLLSEQMVPAPEPDREEASCSQLGLVIARRDRMPRVSDASMKRRICPIISSGQYLQYCKGMGCNAAKPDLVDGESVWYCSLIEPDREECDD